MLLSCINNIHSHMPASLRTRLLLNPLILRDTLPLHPSLHLRLSSGAATRSPKLSRLMVVEAVAVAVAIMIEGARRAR